MNQPLRNKMHRFCNRCHLINVIKNNEGVSVGDALVIIALFSIVIVAVMNMINLSNQSQKNIDQKVASINLTNDISTALSNATACANTVSGTGAFTYDPAVSPTSLSLSNLKNDASTVIYRTFTDSGGPGLKYQSNLLKINSISVYKYTPSSTPANSSDPKFYTGTAKLKVEFGKVSKTPGSQVFMKEITLNVTLTNGGGNDKKIATCQAIATAAAPAPSGTDPWTVLADTTGAYYTKNVYVGSAPATTTIPFEIVATDTNTNLSAPSTNWTSPNDPIFYRLKTVGGGRFDVRSAGKDKGLYLAFGNSGGDYHRLIPTNSSVTETKFLDFTHVTSFYMDPSATGLSDSYTFRFDFGEAATSSIKGLNASSIEQSFMKITHNVRQGGSASHNGLLLTVNEKSVGSGQKNLFKTQTNGTNMVSVTSSGSMLISDGTTNSGNWGPLANLEVRRSYNPMFMINRNNSNGITATVGGYGIVVSGSGSSDSDLRIGAENAKIGSTTESYSIIIKPSRRVGIGYWATGTTFAPAYPLDVVGDFNSSTCFRVGATTVGGTCTSDERLKEDIKEFDLGLKELMKMQPRRYKFNGLGEVAKSEEETVGFIAQELEKVSPELVGERAVKMHAEDTDKTMVKTVNYSKIIYVVINAVKEFYQEFIKEVGDLRQKIQTAVLMQEKSSTEVDHLVAQNEQLKKELTNLKKQFCDQKLKKAE